MGTSSGTLVDLQASNFIPSDPQLLWAVKSTDSIAEISLLDNLECCQQRSRSVHPTIRSNTYLSPPIHIPHMVAMMLQKEQEDFACTELATIFVE
jgi:hypothetical protein